MTDLEKTQAFFNMDKKERQALLINEWYEKNHITVIEKQTLEFMNKHTSVVIDNDVRMKSDSEKHLILKATDPVTLRTVFEKVITKEVG